MCQGFRCMFWFCPSASQGVSRFSSQTSPQSAQGPGPLPFTSIWHMVVRRKVSVATSVARFLPQTSPCRKVRRKVPFQGTSQGSVARFVARCRKVSSQGLLDAFDGCCFDRISYVYIYIYIYLFIYM